MKGKTKKIIIIISVVVFIAIAAVIFFKLSNKDSATGDERLVYVQSVREICGGYTGLTNRYMGVVESQETKSVNKDSDKKVKEVFVQEGDSVKTGDPLFIYDTDDMNLTLKQLKLDLQGLKNEIANANDQINSLAAQAKTVSGEEKTAIQAQISMIKAQRAETEYNVTLKELEIERQAQAIEHATVTSPMDGIIKKIDDSASGNNQGYDDYGGYGGDNNNGGFITIMAVGDYRIKGTISELNLYDIFVGSPVIVRSRIDENITWAGSVSAINQEAESEQNNYYMMEGGGTSASKYAFYVSLDSADNLILGQHVYIELDYGQDAVKEGIWLPSYYIIQDGSDMYVWAKDKKGKIEKRKLTIGEYDEATNTYQVLGGLTEDDYIAFPEESIVAGAPTTNNIEDIPVDDGMMNNGGEDYYIDDSMNEGEFYDGGMVEDGVGMDDMAYPDGTFDDGMIDGGDTMIPDGEGVEVIEDVTGGE